MTLPESWSTAQSHSWSTQCLDKERPTTTYNTISFLVESSEHSFLQDQDIAGLSNTKFQVFQAIGFGFVP